MSKFHSTVSRRDFMKVLGLAGAGLGAAAASAPVFHDLDEASGSVKFNKQPWYVKEVDEPTVEYDLKMTDRYNFRERSSYYTLNDFLGADEVARLKEKQARLNKENLINGAPGNDLKWTALSNGAAFGWNRDFPEFFLGDPFPAYRAESYGVPKWQGTPEEANRIVTAALKFFGASKVAFTKIFSKDHKNWFWDRGRDYTNPTPSASNARISGTFRYVRFEDVDKPYLTDEKKVIPNSYKNIIVFEIPQSDRMTRSGPASGVETGRISAASAQAYGNLGITQRRFQRFMSTLGYQCLGGGTGSLAPVTTWAILSGLGEASRMNPLLTVEWGTMIRSTVIFVTDMPIAPTKPIDAGMWKFCHACGLCAEACPYGALPFDKEPSWEPSGPYNAGGKKVFYINYPQCMRHRNSSGGCDNCMCSCPFSKQQHSSIHDIVKAVSATTSIFNGFFVNMDKAFGYGEKDRPDPEEWWDLNMPMGGIDSTIGTLRMR